MNSYRWKGLYYDSIENCQVSYADHEIVIRSSITGKHRSIIYSSQYQIKTTREWKVTSFEMTYTLSGIHYTVSAYHEGDEWTVNGQVRPEFKNCSDIDITLTPLTNSLPVKRLNLQLDKAQQVEVLYVDVLSNTFRVARQQYTKKSPSVYNFQNVPNDFEADIIVDNEGFVEYYPELFEQLYNSTKIN